MSETFILRTYPFQEADLIVSFFTRDQGKMRGVARRARRPRNNFGSGLERLSLVRLSYFQKENRELVSLDSCELVQSQFGLISDYAVAVGLDYMAETSDHLLPPAEQNERFFRLLAAVLDYLRDGGDLWAAVAYFTLWAVRLSGFLPQTLRIGAESKAMAEEMLRKSLSQLPERSWTKATAADLRRVLVRLIEEHVERKLVTVPLLEAL